jgi:hypothetical protein
MNKKTILISALAGIAASLVTNLFFVKAHASSESVVEAIRNGQCTVTIGNPMYAGSNRCLADRVMTGVWNDQLMCSKIYIECN